MRGLGRLAVVAAAVGVVLGHAPPAGAGSAVTASPSLNSVSFVNDPARPKATVVTSSAVLTRGPARPLTLTLTAAPSGRTVRVGAVVTNRNSSVVTMPGGGLRVEAVVTRNGRFVARWHLRSPSTTSLAPGSSVELRGLFVLPRAGTYDMSGLTRSLL